MALLGNQEKVEYYRNDSPARLLARRLDDGDDGKGRGGHTEVLST